MEIPYTVTARTDTGLWNAKLGIWLFLASEVMLFGGLFSSYIFLRVSADYPWPVGELSVPLGFVNTLVLIGSSVTVVLAWASLKMREFRKFQIYMAITIVCALIFMVIKAFEYTDKFTHYHIKLTDNSIVEGHHHFDDDIEAREVGAVTVNLEQNAKPSLLQEILGAQADGESIELVTESGQKVSVSDLDDWIENRQEILGKAGTGATTERLSFANPVTLRVDPRYVTATEETRLQLRGGESIEAAEIEHELAIEPDLVDLQAVEDPENSPLFDYLDPHVKEEFLKHMEETFAGYHKEHPDVSEEELRHEAEPLRLATRMKILHGEEAHGEGDEHAGIIHIPREEIRYYSNFGPRKNTYYSIYFTLTGLHGLHVVGGAIVLTYFLFTGKTFYQRNPEHLANRVEVGGLFWHFVDLVWIFLFPILYLM